MDMKKSRAAASGTAKSRKSGAVVRKSAPHRALTTSTPQPPAASEAKATIRRLRAELAQTKAQVEALQATAETDFLLAILNRRGFERELNRSIAYIKRYHATAALIVLDVDRLKPINDSFGHAAGDQVLKAIVKTVSSQVRASDVVGRLGGDEFAVLLWISARPTPGPRRPPWKKRSTGSPSCSAATTSARALPPALRSLVRTPKRAARWRRRTARCTCARRNGGMRARAS
jgi:GGDEF domain-containing protein